MSKVQPSSARLEISHLRNMRVSITVTPTDEQVDSMDMALAVFRALKTVPVIQAVVRGEVDDPRFDIPSTGYAQDSLAHCRIPTGFGFGLMSEDDAAADLGVTKRTVQRWALAGKLDSQKYGGERRISRRSVDELIDTWDAE